MLWFGKHVSTTEDGVFRGVRANELSEKQTVLRFIVRNIEQGEARHRKYKRIKLGGGQAYDRSGD
jgi:hypothetical protein